MMFPYRGNLLSLAFASMLAIVWLADATSAALFAANATVRVGYPQPSGAQLPLWVMSEAKLDKKYGFDLQNIYISGGARLTQTLVAGDIDMATTGGAVINPVLSGADLVYIALIVPTYGFSLYARPETKDVPSLKGKVVGVMTKGASSDHGLIALLRHNHLTPGQDVKFLYLARRSSLTTGS
jgi:ABC-type nitrate/sulfonate/bicarbonate transport system substrate-binding protein